MNNEHKWSLLKVLKISTTTLISALKFKSNKEMKRSAQIHYSFLLYLEISKISKISEKSVAGTDYCWIIVDSSKKQFVYLEC